MSQSVTLSQESCAAGLQELWVGAFDSGSRAEEGQPAVGLGAVVVTQLTQSGEQKLTGL